MVSGFLTSPWDQDLIFSGEATETLIALKLSGFLGFSNKLNKSSIKDHLRFTDADSLALLFLNQVDIQSETLELFDHDVKGFRQPRFKQIVAFHNGLIHTRSPNHVI